MHTADGFISRQPYELLISDIDRFRQSVMGAFKEGAFYIIDSDSGMRIPVEVNGNKLMYRR